MPASDFADVLSRILPFTEEDDQILVRPRARPDRVSEAQRAQADEPDCSPFLPFPFSLCLVGHSPASSMGTCQLQTYLAHNLLSSNNPRRGRPALAASVRRSLTRRSLSLPSRLLRLPLPPAIPLALPNRPAFLTRWSDVSARAIQLSRSVLPPQSRAVLSCARKARQARRRSHHVGRTRLPVVPCRIAPFAAPGASKIGRAGYRPSGAEGEGRRGSAKTAPSPGFGDRLIDPSLYPPDLTSSLLDTASFARTRSAKLGQECPLAADRSLQLLARRRPFRAPDHQQGGRHAPHVVAPDG
jgi:hypothetical protein